LEKCKNTEFWRVIESTEEEIADEEDLELQDLESEEPELIGG
jgi:hypothetical protein